jgi:hypothetical protein
LYISTVQSVTESLISIALSCTISTFFQISFHISSSSFSAFSTFFATISFIGLIVFQTSCDTSSYAFQAELTTSQALF